MNEHLSVHVGYGFHVNCYHSYRGDTNDALGFGGDIRIIRRIIADLNRLNARGVPVKGTWDFENAYSLEEILPRYAPDIIADVKERVKLHGDENIIMGYNNGALSGMTNDEFAASIQWAITNAKGSGLLDIFGDYAPLVRPQEMMFTPAQAKEYNRLGIQAVCLYYSCVPFDAFRTIVPQLRDTLAFNPLTYSYAGERMTVLPTYSNADLIDAGCLRALVKNLRAKQLRGEIDADVFIFINMDADAIFWEPLGLPFPLNRVANTQGILGLAEEVADLPYVTFNTPAGYLKDHPPLGEISFGHDTADGSYTGYSSWAEKPFNRQIWTRLERARALAAANGNDTSTPAFEDRVLLLSTTHFGLASPVLNIERERRALELSKRMLEWELAHMPAAQQLTLVNPGGGNIISTELCFAKGWLQEIGMLGLEAPGLLHFGAVALETYEDGSVQSAFALLRFEQNTPQCILNVNNHASAVPQEQTEWLESANLKLHICEHGEVLSVTYQGQAVGGRDFLQSFLTYDGRHYHLQNKRREALPAAGDARGCRVAGELRLPGELRPGSCAFDFFTMPGFDGILIKTTVQYPYTEELHAVSTQSSALGRKCDNCWQQAVPFQLAPCLPDELQVVKRDFADNVTQYPVASFRESVAENENLDSFNHQLTGGFVGICNGEIGLLLANARQILGSMAHCPMRLRRTGGQDHVRLNPFGTYYGRQRVHPSRGDGSVRESFVIVAPQSRSLAPAYNGARETAVLALVGCKMQGGAVPDDSMRQICAFAGGATLLAPAGSPVQPQAAEADHVHFPAAQENRDDAQKLKSAAVSGAGVGGPLQLARVAARALGGIVLRQWKARGN